MLLHGIPVHSYLQRNVIPLIAPHARTVALDFPGFGKSDKPTNIEYNLSTYTKYLHDFIEALGLKGIIIAGMDLGLIVGLNYVMRHTQNVKGLVFFEGFFQTLARSFKCLLFGNRLGLRLIRNHRITEKLIVRDGATNVGRMIKSGTIRALTEDEIEIYRTPFTDEEVRGKVWLEGIGPGNIKPESEEQGDITDLINLYSEKLSASPIPTLLLYATSGSVTTGKALAMARENISHLEPQYVGKGKHFLPEDQPEKIGEAIAGFYRKIIAG